MRCWGREVSDEEQERAADSIHDNEGSLNRDLGGLELFLASAGQLEAQESSVYRSQHT